MDRGGLPLVNHLLQYTLRSLCADSQWLYAVFWRILPRNYPPPKWEAESSFLDRSKGNKRNWILVWEDGFCNFCGCSRSDGCKQSSPCPNNTEGVDEEGINLQPELFFKMSHEIYNYGEGLMGKVAADNSHKWIYREPPEQDVAFLSPWQGSLDPYPRTWEAQFKAGIQTIALVAVGEGLLQLGSLKKIMEDLNFVILLQRKFNYLQSVPGVFAPHPLPELAFSATIHPKDDTCMKQKPLAGINKGSTHISEINRGFKTSDLGSFSLGYNGSLPTLIVGAETPARYGASNKPCSKNILSSGLMSQNGSPGGAMSSLQALLSKLPAVTTTIVSAPSLECSNLISGIAPPHFSPSAIPALSCAGGLLDPCCTKPAGCCTPVEEKTTCSGGSTQAVTGGRYSECQHTAISGRRDCDESGGDEVDRVGLSTGKEKQSGCVALEPFHNVSSQFNDELGNSDTYTSLFREMMNRD